MAWTTPGTAVAGSVLTAAFWNTNVRDNSLAGHPIVTAATRPDSPFEGQMAYETDTNRLLVYNGTAWVQINPVTASVTTSQTTTSVTATDLATVGPAVTVTTGTTALVTLSSWITPAAGTFAIMTLAVSGATTIAATAGNGIFHQSPAAGAQQVNSSRTFLISGLTAGNNTFTSKYYVTAGTGTFESRSITVVGLL